MERQVLEIISISDLKERFGNDFSRDTRICGDPQIKNYSKLETHCTPYIEMAKTEEKSKKRIKKEIRRYARKINADLAVVESTNTHYPNNTFSQDVIYYNKISN